MIFNKSHDVTVLLVSVSGVALLVAVCAECVEETEKDDEDEHDDESLTSAREGGGVGRFRLRISDGDCPREQAFDTRSTVAIDETII